MRSLGLWSLIAFMALNLVFGHHWVHVPALLQHYQEHQAEGQDVSGFIGFLELHYADADHHGSDDAHDELPFKHHHKSHIGVDHVLWSPVVGDHLISRSAGEEKALFDRQDLLDGFRSACLQPPRLA